MATEALRTGNEAEMVIALKALGNAGHPGSIKTIMRFLPGVAANPVNLPPRVLSAAVQSMRLIAARDPHSVRTIYNEQENCKTIFSLNHSSIHALSSLVKFSFRKWQVTVIIFSNAVKIACLFHVAVHNLPPYIHIYVTDLSKFSSENYRGRVGAE